MVEITKELADGVLRISYDDLTDAVIYKMKQLILDCIGCALGSRVVDRARIALELIAELGGKCQGAIIGGGRTSWALASYVNGELINALDFDPVGPSGHVAPGVIPPCLALAERMKASGRDLITAAAAALEIGDRVQSSVPHHTIVKQDRPGYEQNPRFSHALPVFGGVAGASMLLKLNSRQVANAFGIAGASMPVPAGKKWEQNTGPMTMVKYGCLAGWTAQLATTAALLGERDFTGDTTFFDGDWGFPTILGMPYFKPENIIGDLGNRWHIEEIEIKAYPCCAFNHMGIRLINQIMRENNIEPDDIEEIVVKGGSQLLTPQRVAPHVVSFSDCQFRNAYIFAAAVYYGQKVGPNWQMPGTYKDPNILDLMKRIRAEVHPRADEITNDRIKAGLYLLVSFPDTIVEIISKGKKYSAEYIGDIAVGQSITSGGLSTDNEIRDKFRNNASFSSLTTRRVDEIIDAVYRLDEIDDISEITRLLANE